MKLKPVLQILMLGLALAALRVGLGWAALTISPLGEQRTLVYMINGGDPGAAFTGFFGTDIYSVDSFYRTSSYGKTWFTGDVVSVSIVMPSTCDLPAIADRSDAAAVAQGFNLDLYTRRAYVGGYYGALPYSCPLGIGVLGQAGTTSGGTTYGKIWLAALGPQIHEMGHSLGMTHANCYNYDRERCDPTDVMGSAGRENNAPHRVELGFLFPSQVQDVIADGVYSVSPLEISDGSVKVLRIARPSTEQFFYISYRQRIGPYDSTFYPTLTDGVSIHIWNPTGALGTLKQVPLIVDTTPGSDGWFLDAPLSDGRTFSDSGVNITQLSHDAGRATVSISFGSPPPEPPPPEPPPPEPPPDCRPRGKSGKCK